MNKQTLFPDATTAATGRRGVGRVIGTLLNVAAGLVVFLLIAEALLRLFYFGPDAFVHAVRYQPLDSSRPFFLVLAGDSRIAVELRPNHRWFFLGRQRWTNRLGLADEPPAAGKRRPTIVVLGESYAEGGGVNMKDRFSALLEQKLQQYGRYHVLNIAITNTVLESQIELLRKNVLPYYQVSHVLVCFLARGNMNAPVLPQRDWKYRIEHGTDMFPLWKRSFALFIVRDYWVNLLSRAQGFVMRKQPDVGTNDGSSGSEPPDRVTTLLGELRSMGRAQGFSVMLAPLPHMKYLHQPDHDAADRGRLRAIAIELGLAYIDLLPCFSGIGERSCILWSFNRHPNAFAHAVLADALARDLYARHLLDRK